jgi:hypothetical protein
VAFMMVSPCEDKVEDSPAVASVTTRITKRTDPAAVSHGAAGRNGSVSEHAARPRVFS